MSYSETTYFSIKDSQTGNTIPIIKEVYPEAWRGASWNNTNHDNSFNIVYEQMYIEDLKSETSLDIDNLNTNETSTARLFNNYNIYYNGMWRKVFKVLDKPTFINTYSYQTSERGNSSYTNTTGNGDGGIYYILNGHTGGYGSKGAPKYQDIFVTSGKSYFIFNRHDNVDGTGWVYWRINTKNHSNTTNATNSNLTPGRVLIIENEDLLTIGGNISTE